MAASGGKDSDYKEFESSPSDSHNYEYDSGRTALWFKNNSNIEDLYPQIQGDRQVERAFEDWGYGHFMYGQQYGGFSKMTSEDQKRTRIYDKILDKARLDQPIVVHRRATAELLLGKNNTWASEEDIKNAIEKGEPIIQKANMSTGAGNAGLTIGSRKQIDYEIRIPKGKGYGMWIGDSRVNGWGDKQREFMTNRDLVLKPVGYRKVLGGTGGSKPMYVVIMQVVGRMKHDYS